MSAITFVSLLICGTLLFPVHCPQAPVVETSLAGKIIPAHFLPTSNDSIDSKEPAKQIVLSLSDFNILFGSHVFKLKINDSESDIANSTQVELLFEKQDTEDFDFDLLLPFIITISSSITLTALIMWNFTKNKLTICFTCWIVYGILLSPLYFSQTDIEVFQANYSASSNDSIDSTELTERLGLLLPGTYVVELKINGSKFETAKSPQLVFFVEEDYKDFDFSLFMQMLLIIIVYSLITTWACYIVFSTLMKLRQNVIDQIDIEFNMNELDHHAPIPTGCFQTASPAKNCGSKETGTKSNEKSLLEDPAETKKTQPLIMTNPPSMNPPSSSG